MTLFLSLLGIFVFGTIGVMILFDVGLPGIGGEFVVPVTALTFAIWGFAGVMVLWDSRRSYQGFLITVPMMLPFVFSAQLQFFALVGVWGGLLSWLAWRVYQRQLGTPSSPSKHRPDERPTPEKS